MIPRSTHAAHALLFPLAALAIFGAEEANAQAITMNWYTIDAGGGTSSSGVFQLRGTIGQPDAGSPLAAGPYTLTSGFWPGITWPCFADFNRDGLLNSQDFFDFLTAFFANEPAADVNHDAIVNSQDFFDFLTVFFSGC